MLNRLSKLVAGILIAGSLTTLVWAQAAPNWKDQGESDIGIAAGNEKDPAKQLELLKKWEQQYPQSALAGQRTLMTANALLTVMGAAYGKTDPAVVTAGQKAGQQLEDHFQEYFSDSVKPAPTTPEQWAATRKLSEMQVHLVMAYIAQFQKNDTAAEAELKKVLTVDPTQASASYQLGSIILHEMATTKDVSRYPEAIYELARSVAVTGANALTAQLKTSANTSLQKNYSNYHGSTDGLEDLIKLASASPLPPSGFHIESVVEIQAAKEKDHAAWAAAHPDLDFWETIRSALVAQGDAYFSNLKDVGFPPPVGDSYKGPAMFRAKVVSQPTPKEILVNVDGIPTGDAILKLDDNVKGDIPAGTDIQFKGVVDSYTKDPYVLTMNIQEPKTDITGLPDDIKFVPDGAAKPKPAGRGGKAGTKAGTKATKKAQ